MYICFMESHKEKALELFEKAKEFANPRGHKDFDDDDEFKNNCKGIARLIIKEAISACEYNLVEIHNTIWWTKVEKELDLI